MDKFIPERICWLCESVIIGHYEIECCNNESGKIFVEVYDTCDKFELDEDLFEQEL